MTYERFDVDPMDALATKCAEYPGGISTLATRMAINAGTLRKKLSVSPTADTHKLNLPEFSVILDRLEEVGVADWNLPLRALCWRHNHVALPLPDADADSGELLASVVDIFSKEGKLAESIQESLGDRKITDREMKHIESNIERVIEALVVLRERVRQKNEADFHGAK